MSARAEGPAPNWLRPPTTTPARSPVEGKDPTGRRIGLDGPRRKAVSPEFVTTLEERWPRCQALALPGGRDRTPGSASQDGRCFPGERQRIPQRSTRRTTSRRNSPDRHDAHYG